MKRIHSSTDLDDLKGSTNVFINYLPADFTEIELIDLCMPYGTIESAKVMIDLLTGQSKCFGFVNFMAASNAEDAIKGLNGKRIQNKRLLAKEAVSQSKQQPPSPYVFVKGIPATVAIQEACSAFAAFGRIISVHRDTSNSAIFQYHTIEEAQSAIDTMNNTLFHLTNKPIMVKFANNHQLRIRPSHSSDSIHSSCASPCCKSILFDDSPSADYNTGIQLFSSYDTQPIDIPDTLLTASINDLSFFLTVSAL